MGHGRGMDPDRFLFNLPSVPDYPGECPLSDVTNGKIFPMYSARSGEQVICFNEVLFLYILSFLLYLKAKDTSQRKSISI